MAAAALPIIAGAGAIGSFFSNRTAQSRANAAQKKSASAATRQEDRADVVHELDLEDRKRLRGEADTFLNDPANSIEEKLKMALGQLNIQDDRDLAALGTGLSTFGADPQSSVAKETLGAGVAANADRRAKALIELPFQLLMQRMQILQGTNPGRTSQSLAAAGQAASNTSNVFDRQAQFNLQQIQNPAAFVGNASQGLAA